MEKTKNVKVGIEGMTCAACSASVDRALRKLNGVVDVNVNLATNSATIKCESFVKEEDCVATVNKTGFVGNLLKEEDIKIDISTNISNTRLVIGLIFGFLTMFVGMSHMLHYPVPNIISHTANPLNYALVQFIFTIPVLIVGRNFFINGTKNLIKLHPNMDSLVSLGTGVAFIYSTYHLIMLYKGNMESINSLYFESSAVVIALVLLGKYLEERSKNSAKRAISSLVSMIPSSAIVFRNGKEMEVKAKDVAVDDIVIVKAGSRIPVDGIVVEGNASVDQSMLTGESIPIHMESQSHVSGGTICKDGMLKVKATGVGNNTAISQVLKLVTEAQERKAPSARLADKISGVFVPTVFIIAIVVTILWSFSGKPTGFVLNIFVAILVVACPCSLGLATPIAVIAGSGRGANLGLLFRGGDIIEESSKIDTILFDKTGTITKGKLKVDKIYSSENISEEEMIRLCASAEYGSEHPIAVAINEYAQNQFIEVIPPKSTKSIAGRGIIATTTDKTVTAGTLALMELEKIHGYQTAHKLEEGFTAIYIAVDGIYCGMITLSDTIREDAKSTISKLNNMGIETVMITGDNLGSANMIAKEAGIKTVRAQVLPQDKSKAVEEFKKLGKHVAMVGDGINDAPALSAADVGIAISSGTDVAAESSGIILMRDDLKSVIDALKLSKKTMRIIKENLFWAFIYNSIGIPIAGGLLYLLFAGPLFSPMFAGAAMAFSSVSVVTNSLRLTKYNPNK